MSPVKMDRIPTLLWVLLLLATQELAAQNQQSGSAQSQQDSSHDGSHQPAPEPYSFSYTSESVGGQSSHQESGDGSGRVTGFYTIMGEDGRERRVDYVADENGYRASVSTNEVGTRNENSADAQYNVRLPSDKQLEMAKVTAEQYQYLEETHAAERERQLARLGSKEQSFQQTSGQWSSSTTGTSGQSFQQQQQQRPNQQAAWRQQSAGSFSSPFGAQQQSNQRQFGSSQSNQAANNRQPFSAPFQQGGGSSFSSSSSSSTSQPGNNGQPADWRQSSNFAANSQQTNAGQAAGWPLKANSDGQVGLLGENQQQSSTESVLISQGDVSQGGANSALNASWQQQLFGAQQQQREQGQRLDGVQQFQQAAWMMASRGGVPTRKPATTLQKQLEVQFMQQAQQLTDQDYPRQQAYLANQRYQDRYSQQFNGPTAQAQPQTLDKIQKLVVSANSEQQPTEQTNQINQQQANIIDEINDQVDGQVGVDQQVNVAGGAGPSLIVQPQRKETNYQSGQFLVTTNRPNVATFAQQQRQPVVSTFNQTVPSGFVSIPLVEQNNNNIASTTASQFQQQEVDQRPYSTIAPGQSTSQFGYNQFVNQSTTSGQTQPADYQQVSIGTGNQQQQQLEEISSRPDSIKQIIEQQKQQAIKQQELQFTRPTSFSRPVTTTTNPLPIYQTTPGPLLIETTRTPAYLYETTTPRQIVYTLPSSTTTSSQTSATEVTVEDQTVEYRPLVSTTVQTIQPGSSQSTRRPQQQQQQQLKQQQQVITSNIKGGSQYARQQNTRPFNPRPINNTFADNTAFNRETSAPLRPSTNFGAIFTATSKRPITNYYENQTTKPSPEIPRVPAQIQTQPELQRRPIVSSPYGIQQQQQATYQSRQPISSLQTNFTRPERVEYTQQQPSKGTKGGSSSKTNKRQFWLSPQQQVPVGRNLTSTGNTQSNVGVDYANTADFGLRVAGRLR